MLSKPIQLKVKINYFNKFALPDTSYSFIIFYIYYYYYFKYNIYDYTVLVFVVNNMNIHID